MKKLICGYEEKNKIIEEIQRNLRKPTAKGPNLRYQGSAYSQDLPSVLSRRTFLDAHLINRKSPSLSNQLPKRTAPKLEDLNEPLNRKPYVQTISFKNEQITPLEGYLLIKHRSTMKNFMRTSYRSQPPSKQDESAQIFLSPKKMLSVQKPKILLNDKQKKRRSSSSLQKKPDDLPQKNEQTEKQKRSQQIEEFNRLVLESGNRRHQTRRAAMLQIIRKDPQSRTLDLDQHPERYWPQVRRKGRRERESASHCYSPWTSEHSQEIHEIWSTQRS